jgi:integrase/recombinase XerD
MRIQPRLCRAQHKRYTFATTALRKGISLPTVQKILGHDRLQTTAIYLNYTDVHIQDEFERKW